MTLKNALAEIKARNKPYLEVNMPQGTFTNTIKAIEYGFAKPKTIDCFMMKFGYSPIKTEEKWERLSA